jgi:hypothetical protein
MMRHAPSRFEVKVTVCQHFGRFHPFRDDDGQWSAKVTNIHSANMAPSVGMIGLSIYANIKGSRGRPRAPGWHINIVRYCYWRVVVVVGFCTPATRIKGQLLGVLLRMTMQVYYADMRVAATAI